MKSFVCFFNFCPGTVFLHLASPTIDLKHPCKLMLLSSTSFSVLLHLRARWFTIPACRHSEGASAEQQGEETLPTFPKRGHCQPHIHPGQLWHSQDWVLEFVNLHYTKRLLDLLDSPSGGPLVSYFKNIS